MPRLTRVMTRLGDDGRTMLGSGRRLAKDAPRVEAYGAVDELNSALGAALAAGLRPRLAAIVEQVQNDLFLVGADLCREERRKAKVRGPSIEARHVRRLEGRLQELLAQLQPSRNFVLPGGAPGAAQLQLARAVCRRAERRVVRLRRRETIGPHVLPYLNRLGDLLFVMARHENMKRRVPEKVWDSRG